MILLAYDGSDDAKAAITATGRLHPGRDVTIVTVWERFYDAMARTGSMTMALGSAYSESTESDRRTEEAAAALAEEGGALAGEAGLIAFPRTATRHNGIAETLLRTAAEVGADLIVVGTRGRSAMKTFVMGSVSHDLLQHADRPVMVTPSATVVERRAAHH